MAEDNPLKDLVDPVNSTSLEDGSTEYQFPDDPTLTDNVNPEGLDLSSDHHENLAHYLSDEELSLLADEVIEGYLSDEASRESHMQAIVDSIKSLGLNDKEVTKPFEGACTVTHPLLMESSVKLQAKASNELLPANGPVKTQILGTIDDKMEKQAGRVRTHMNWQLTTQMPEYYPNSEKGYLHAALFGDAFKKPVADPIANRVRDQLITLDKLVVNNSTESIQSAERITELQAISEVTFKQRIYSGLYVDYDPGEAYRLERTELQSKIDDLLGVSGEDMYGYEILEQHVFKDLPGFEDQSGVPLPYVIHVERDTRTVLGIYRNWCPEGSKFVKREWYAHYGLVPAFGFYHLGYVHLLGGFQKTLSAILRSLIDAGQFANMQGGFKAKTMRIDDGGGKPLAPGEFRDVENFGQDIRNAIVPLPFKEPSGTLYELLQFMEVRGQKFADSTEQVIADSANYGPVGTTMALLDASTKFFSSIHKRFHRAQKQELALIAYLNYEMLPTDDSQIAFNVPGETVHISKADYSDRIEISPVSDPNISSNAHRMQLASTKLQAAQGMPAIHDMRAVYHEFYSAMDVENVDKILPPQEQPQPLDPIGDIKAASSGKPIMAFPDQDHDAHIQIKNAFIQSAGQDPSVASIIPAIQANIRDHQVLKFANQMKGTQAQLGVDAISAAQMVAKNNAFLQANPAADKDPKVLLALAEQQSAANDAAKIQLDAKKADNSHAVDLANIITTMRGQDLQAMSHGVGLQNDQQIIQFQEALKLVHKVLDHASTMEVAQLPPQTPQGQ